MQDTVDATFGFLALFVPFLCLCVSFFGLLAPTSQDKLLPIAVLVAFAPAVFAWVYFPWCLSACHRDTTWLQAMFACSISMVVMFGALNALA